MKKRLMSFLILFLWPSFACGFRDEDSLDLSDHERAYKLLLSDGPWLSNGAESSSNDIKEKSGLMYRQGALLEVPSGSSEPEIGNYGNGTGGSLELDDQLSVPPEFFNELDAQVDDFQWGQNFAFEDLISVEKPAQEEKCERKRARDPE